MVAFKMLLRTVGSITGGLLAAETLLRLLADPPIPSSQHHQLFCEFDPLLGWRKIPNARGFHVTPEYQVYERLNSRGLRSREHPVEKPKNQKRLLFLGDSFTEGYSVHFHELFSERLERQLNIRGEGEFCCINAGTGGYSTDQELLYFRSEGREYQPDMTVLMFYENDVIDNTLPVTHRAAKPLFHVDPGGCPVPANLPLPKPPAPNAKSSGLAKRVIAKSYALSMGCASLELLGVVTEMGRRKLATKRPGYKIPLCLRVWEETWPAQVEEAWQLTTALIADLRDSVVQAGSRFAIFYIPPQWAVYPEVFEMMCNVWGMPRRRVSPFTLGKRLVEWCLRQSIEYIDPTADFRSEARRLTQAGSDRLYYLLDGHWTWNAHALAADILSGMIGVSVKH